MRVRFPPPPPDARIDDDDAVADRNRVARLKLRDRITSTVSVEVQETEAYEVAFADLSAFRDFARPAEDVRLRER